MRDRARAVVIGGGVGGCSILYWLARLGWEDVVLVERAELTSGSTFHSAGLVGQLRSSLALTKMMMESVDLYRSLEAEVGLETGWHEVGSLRLASSPERMEEIARQAGWAKTFGLPLELISPAEAQELFPPMTTDGVPRRRLPSDRRLHRPEPADVRARRGSAPARRGGGDVDARHRRSRVDRGRVTGVETDRGSIETEIVVNAGGMYAREIGALAGVNVPIVPMAHEYLITKPAGLPLEMPTMRDPSLLVYFRPESGGLIMGGYERHCAPWGLDGIPARLQLAAARGGLAALRGADGERGRARALARRDGGREAHQRPGGVHARRRVHPRPVGRARLLGGGRLLRPRARRRRRHGEARRGVDRRRHAVARRVAHGLAPLRRRVPKLASTPSRARRRSTRRTTTSSTPGTSARRDGRCASRPPTRASRSSARPSARSPAGSGRTGSSRTRRAVTSRFVRAAGQGSSGHPRSAPSTRACRETAAIFDETSFAKIDVTRRGSGRVSRAALREPRRAGRRPGDVHADAQRDEAASSATSR